MSMILFLAIMAVLGTAFALLLREKFEWMLPVSIFYVIIILYISGLSGSFTPGFCLLLLSVPALMTAAIIRSRKNVVAELKSYVLTPGFLFFILCMAWMYRWISVKQINTWDEFDHWSLIIKNFFYLNNMGNEGNSTILFKTYPPAAALFALFAQRMGSSYVACKSYLAYAVMYVGLLLPLFASVKRWREWPKMIGITVCVILLPVIFVEDAYDITYVDMLMGVLFGYLVTTYLFHKKSVIKYISILAGAFTLCLMKPYGFEFAVAGGGIIGFGEAVACLRERKDSKKLRKTIQFLLMLIAVIFTARFTWNSHLEQINTAGEIITERVLENSVKVDEQERTEMPEVFAEGMLKVKLGTGIIKMPCILWIILLGAAIALLYLLNRGKEYNRAVMACLTCMLVGFCAYLILLLLSYETLFNVEEAVNLRSLDRYAGTYLEGMMVVLTAIFWFTVSNKAALAGLTGGIMLVSYLPVFGQITTARPDKMERYEEYEIDIRFQRLQADLEKMDRNIKVYFIHQNDVGYWYFACNYALTPYPCQNWRDDPYSLPCDTREGVADEELRDDWADTLRDGGFTYVFLNHIEGDFMKVYGEMFENPKEVSDATLYTIEEDAFGKVMLKKVQGIQY